MHGEKPHGDKRSTRMMSFVVLLVVFVIAASVAIYSLLTRRRGGLNIFTLCTEVPDNEFIGDLGPGTISVWSHGHAYDAQELFNSVLRAALPGYQIVWGRKRGEIAIAMVTHFIDMENSPPPADIPYVVWSGESFDVRDCILPKRNNERIASLLSTSVTKVDEFHVPFMSTRLTLPPPTMRERVEDDIASRKYALGYINSHCVPERERFFNMMRDRLGADAVIARGACSSRPGDRDGGAYKDSWVDLMSDCKAIIAMENKRLRGYVTEKIVDAFRTGAIPVYWGDMEFVESVFNPEAYFDVAKYARMEDAADALAALLTDDRALRSKQHQPVLQPGGYRFFDWENDASAFQDLVQHLRRKLSPSHRHPGAGAA